MRRDDRGCRNCAGAAAPLPMTFAFQPIVDIRAERIFSYEALVRGPGNEPAVTILEQVDASNRYRFDQSCRVGAIALAARLGITANLNINFMPNAVYVPENCIRTTFAAAEEHGFPIERIIFEVVENDPLGDPARLIEIMREYKRFGFLNALDDFGNGYRDLALLADFQPDIIKLDMRLLRDIDHNAPRQIIVSGMIAMCRDLGITLLAEGVETFEEYAWLDDAGVTLFQGYLFGRPAFQAAEPVDFTPFRRTRAPVVAATLR